MGLAGTVADVGRTGSRLEESVQDGSPLMFNSNQHHHEEHVLFVPTAEPAYPPAIHTVTQGHGLPQMQIFGFE
jgi:hypothetical protein